MFDGKQEFDRDEKRSIARNSFSRNEPDNDNTHIEIVHSIDSFLQSKWSPNVQMNNTSSSLASQITDNSIEHYSNTNDGYGQINNANAMHFLIANHRQTKTYRWGKTDHTCDGIFGMKSPKFDKTIIACGG